MTAVTVVTAVTAVTVVTAGWSSNSGHSLLGGLRALAQTVSYEVRLEVKRNKCFVVRVLALRIVFGERNTSRTEEFLCI